MAKQTFTAGQVLTAAEMNSLQENDYNWTVTTKTASYTLAAGDEGTRIVMNNAGATTITVDDAVFSAGDVVWIHNIGAGTCTVTAGTATVSTLGELALEQYAGGHLYFTSASAAIFFPTEQGGGGKIIAVKHAYKTDTFSASLTAGGNAAITDLSISHALSNSANKVLMFGAVHGDGGRIFTMNAALAIDDVLYVGDADGSRIRVGSTNIGSTLYGQVVTNLSAVFEPGDTSSHDYEAFIISTSDDTRTGYVNRSVTNSNDYASQRPVSWIVLMEVSA